MPSQLEVTVPFVDLPASFEPIGDELFTALGEIVASGAFTNGPAVREFEREFADFCGVEDCVGLASGLDAVRLALQALDVGPGDEVLVPAMTFFATWEAVSQVGAQPVPVDVLRSDYGIDPHLLERAAGARARAVVPVHLYGQMVDPSVYDVASRLGLEVVEDACQAHGARRAGALAGSIGRAAAFSFYPTKNLGGIGDGGALVTSDRRLADRVRALREHGQEEKGKHRHLGWTARLDTIQAATLLLKLPYVEEGNAGRVAAASWYENALSGVGDLVLPGIPEGSDPAWHVYVVITRDPAALAAYLRERGIATGRHYPEPPHLSEAYRSLGHVRGDFPVAEELAFHGLSLPLFPTISEQQLEATAAAIRDYFRA